MSARRLTRALVRLALLAVSSAAVVAGAEWWVRSADPFGVSYLKDVNRYFREGVVFPPDAAREDGRVFENRPGADLAFRRFRFAADAYGLRAARPDAEPPAARGAGTGPDGPFRILFLGDSVTFAWGVDDEASWVRVLERTARRPDGSPVECLNAGHPHYDTTQEADWLLAKGLALEPDLVVLTYVSNDLESSWEVYQSILAAEPEESGSIERRVDAWLPGLHALWVLARERRRARTPDEHADLPVEERPDYVAGWPRSEAALDRLLAATRGAGIPLVVLDHSVPAIPDVPRWCERSGVPWYDLRFTPEERERGVVNSVADPHANELGNRLLAEKARAHLAAAGFLAE